MNNQIQDHLDQIHDSTSSTAKIIIYELKAHKTVHYTRTLAPLNEPITLVDKSFDLVRKLNPQGYAIVNNMADNYQDYANNINDLKKNLILKTIRTMSSTVLSISLEKNTHAIINQLSFSR